MKYEIFMVDRCFKQTSASAVSHTVTILANVFVCFFFQFIQANAREVFHDKAILLSKPFPIHSAVT